MIPRSCPKCGTTFERLNESGSNAQYTVAVRYEEGRGVGENVTPERLGLTCHRCGYGWFVDIPNEPTKRYAEVVVVNWRRRSWQRLVVQEGGIVPVADDEEVISLR